MRQLCGAPPNISLLTPRMTEAHCPTSRDLTRRFNLAFLADRIQPQTSFGLPEIACQARRSYDQGYIWPVYLVYENMTLPLPVGLEELGAMSNSYFH